jgi:chaperone BCS1
MPPPLRTGSPGPAPTPSSSDELAKITTDTTASQIQSVKPPPSYFDSLKDNPYFGAGFGLVAIGALMSVLKKGTAVGYTVAQKRLTVSLEVVSRDKCYDWLLKWINAQLKDKAQHTSVETFFQKNDRNERVTTSFSFIPSVGIHYFKYKSTWFRAERVRETVVDRITGSPVESLKLTTIGANHKIFEPMLNEARNAALSQQVGKTLIYRAGLGADWGLSGWPKDKRPFSSVVLDQGVSESIKSDILDFLKNRKWYFDRGIPYRRGYLLYGPPGCGKTSFVTALAGYYFLIIY